MSVRGVAVLLTDTKDHDDAPSPLKPAADEPAPEFAPDEGCSHVYAAALMRLNAKHSNQRPALWNVSSGRIVGSLAVSPQLQAAPLPAHAQDWLPERMREILSRTEAWADVLSLTAPDGLFLEELARGLTAIAHRAVGKPKPTVIRMMFGNIIGAPVNCESVLSQLTQRLPPDANLKVWVGAWRAGFSWNHAKIIAVDGRDLFTGGHNMWDPHYLQINPIHDMSIGLEGTVAHDAHFHANHQWRYVQAKQSTCLGQILEKAPDWLPLITATRVIVSEYPKGKAAEFPPAYSEDVIPESLRNHALTAGIDVRILSLGRSGGLDKEAEPSDNAFLAMIGAAQTVIRCSLQDVGPMCWPGTKRPLPGTSWPKPLLAALAEAIWARGVDVQIILSNPDSVPGGLEGPMATPYSNGWTCAEVASEIIKEIRKRHADADALRKVVEENLFVCYLRHFAAGDGYKWENDVPLGLHDKHFIIDDVCCYIGSQNLYVCDLAEWGVVIDSAAETKLIMQQYWDRAWACSFQGIDCDVQEVMDGLDVDREPPKMPLFPSRRTREVLVQAECSRARVGTHSHNPGIYSRQRKQAAAAVAATGTPQLEP